MARGRNGSRARGRTAPPVLGDRERGDERRFRGHGLAGIWNPGQGQTLNGTRVSALGEVCFGVLTVSQATAGNQPLATGAPVLNGSPSLDFNSTRQDCLFRVNTNLKGTLGVTIISVQQLTSCPPAQGGVVCNEPAATTAGVGLSYNTSPGNQASWHDAAFAFRTTTGASSTTVPEVWMCREPHSSQIPIFWVNNVAKALSGGGAATPSDPGSSATLSIGTFYPGSNHTPNMYWYGGSWFQSVLPDSVVRRICKARGARVGLRIAA